MTARTRPWLQRLSFAEGAALRARDLDDLASYEAGLIGLHVRAVHDTAGVAEGLELSLDPSRRLVTVSAGAAITRCGDVIALHRPITIEGPRRPTLTALRSRFVLALGAPAPSEAGPCERLLRCLDAPPTMRVPVVRWVPVDPAVASEALRSRDEVPLGSVVRLQDGTLEAPDAADRLVVRALSRPHLKFDVMKLGALDWSPTMFPLRARIDTSAAGFSTTPVYFASLAGNAALPSTYVGPFLSIEQPSRTGFTLRLILAHRPPQPAASLLAVVMTHLANADVRWTGLETVRGCP